MRKERSKMTNLELAKEFMRTSEKETILADIFDYFKIACLERCHLNVKELDRTIRVAEASGWEDEKALADVIRIIRIGEEEIQRKENLLVQEIKKAILQNWNDDITVEAIAEKLYISYYYMCHFFKQYTGVSVTTFRTQKRLEQAMRQLWTTGKKISEIAVEAGFNTSSYFAEIFTKNIGMAPLLFREKVKGKPFHSFYEYEDMIVAADMPCKTFLSPDLQRISSDKIVESVVVRQPDEQFRFLHEAAIMEYHGVLYASWYQCPQWELRGYTPICGKRSYDGGKTWSELEYLAEDPTQQILYCPPVYGVENDTLYLLVNQMVAPDHIHSLDLYALNNETQKFELRWSRPIPFKLNTNVVSLSNGKKMLPGRVGELDGFPNTPAVLISDSGKIDDEWRLVKIAENGDLPREKTLVHPEISVICAQEELYMFCRNDQSRIPLVYHSSDCGEHWSPAYSHDFPYVSSKMYCGDLQDGRHYMICNDDDFQRAKLVAYITEDESFRFCKKMVLFDQTDKENGYKCHYPVAHEANGKLYVIATLAYPESPSVRGAQLFLIDLEKF